MVDLPKKIFASSVTENYGEWQTVTDGLPRPQEYTRSDLVAELAAENERLKQRLASHSRATNPVEDHGMADVSDKPEGQQEPVAYIKEVLRIFGQGCTNAGPTSPFGGNPADCDECLTAAAMSIRARPSEQAVTEAAGPFVTFAKHAVEKTDDGWVWRTSSNERICDWFGPSDFGALKAAMEAGR